MREYIFFLLQTGLFTFFEERKKEMVWNKRFSVCGGTGGEEVVSKVI
jgi:hypothetical protein